MEINLKLKKKFKLQSYPQKIYYDSSTHMSEGRNKKIPSTISTHYTSSLENLTEHNQRISFQKEIFPIIENRPNQRNSVGSDEYEDINNNEINKLDHWEKKCLEKFSFGLKRKNAFQNQNSLHFVNELNGNITKYESFGKNQQNELQKKFKEEQGTLFFNNLNISRAKFNFNVFKNKDPMIMKKKSKLEGEDHTEEFLKSLNGINGDFNEIDFVKISSHEFYRDVIQSRTKRELRSRNDYFKISTKIFEIKTENKRINNLNNEILQKLEENTLELNQVLLNKQLKMKYFQSIINNKNHNDYDANDYETMNERLNIREISLKNEKFENEANQDISELNNEIDNLRNKLIFNYSKIERNNNQIKNLKDSRVKLIQEQIIYYKDILKLGIDVRNEGLKWIVKRLIELNENITHELFPKFLDKYYIDFIMNVSIKECEITNLKNICRILAVKQKNIDDKLETEKSDGFQKNFAFNFKNCLKINNCSNNMLNSFNNTNFSNKTKSNFQNLFKKYSDNPKSVLKISNEDEENIQIHDLVSKLLSQLKNNNHNKESFNVLYKRFSLTEIPDDKSTKTLINEILIIKSKIKEMENDLSYQIENELTKFKKTHSSYINGKYNPTADMLYSALFGNNKLI